MFINFYEVGRKRSPLYIFDSPFKLHLDLLNLLRLFLFLSLEVEVVDVLGVKRLDPLGNDQTLLEELNFFILPLVLSLCTCLQVCF